MEKKNWKKNWKKNLKKILRKNFDKKIWKKNWEKKLEKKFRKKFWQKFFPNFFFKIFSLIFFQDPWKIHELFMISWIIMIIHEIFMNYSWIIHEIFMKYSWIFKKILRRNLEKNFEKKNLIHIITRKIPRGVLATRVCLALFSGFVSRVSQETHACCEHPTRDFLVIIWMRFFFSKFSSKFLLIIFLNIHEYFMNISWIFHEYFMNYSWIIHEYFMNNHE